MPQAVLLTMPVSAHSMSATAGLARVARLIDRTRWRVVVDLDERQTRGSLRSCSTSSGRAAPFFELGWNRIDGG